ncbi:SGNH/GDSL hydrolase family protein [Streptomyces alkaliphilus]|uniref:SGNH/GDSL hydrolase family protein n=1 Tax=Streptomyces alkaliphilus TaxID=1472722 RepID=UPI00117C044B|nr:SGNH/GDSL hydrolase family protein [Streptomyces alkaliphilus]MQS06904.1 SGNH/GDSL hydrolase family protein [Streptomyces alkaliphilus]
MSPRPTPHALTTTAGALACLLGLGLLTGCGSGADDGQSADRGATAEGTPDPGDGEERDEGDRGTSDAGPEADAEAVPDDGSPVLVALGDSITTGFDSCGVLADCPEVSWSTGTEPDVESLASRLDITRVWNEAVSGARMADLPAQAQRAAAREPDLVTVLIGANDACAATPATMTPVEDFRADFEEALGIIRDGAPDARLFVASVPDLQHLWEEGRQYPEALQVWRFGICPSMLADPEALTPQAEERRTEVRERVVEYNAALAEVCADDVNCRYDDGAVFEYTFTADDLSEWDWFHPSREGQRALAELAYERLGEE